MVETVNSELIKAVEDRNRRGEASDKIKLKSYVVEVFREDLEQNPDELALFMNKEGVHHQSEEGFLNRFPSRDLKPANKRAFKLVAQDETGKVHNLCGVFVNGQTLDKNGKNEIQNRDLSGDIFGILDNPPEKMPSEANLWLYYTITTWSSVKGAGDECIKKVAEFLNQEAIDRGDEIPDHSTMSPSGNLKANFRIYLRDKVKEKTLNFTETEQSFLLSLGSDTSDEHEAFKHAFDNYLFLTSQQQAKFDDILYNLSLEYFIEAKSGSGRPYSPVQDFHTGTTPKKDVRGWMEYVKDAAQRKTIDLNGKGGAYLANIHVNMKEAMKRGAITLDTNPREKKSAWFDNKFLMANFRYTTKDRSISDIVHEFGVLAKKGVVFIAPSIQNSFNERKNALGQKPGHTMVEAIEAIELVEALGLQVKST